MPLFRIDGKSVRKIAVKDLAKERELQDLFESNLQEILNIEFLAREYPTSFGGRIDTLGIDNNGSPCIIEYKRNKNDSVINQGLSYLRWLLDHRAEFEQLCKKSKIDIDIDWTSPRVICVAESYNKYDIDTADILPINIELLRYSVYKEDILQVASEEYQKVNVNTTDIVKKAKQTEAKLTLQKTYTVDDHLKNAGPDIREMFNSLREKILSLDQSIKEEPKKLYIAYKLSTNFCDVVLAPKKMIVYLNVKSGILRDPYGIARDLMKPKVIGHWGNGDYDIWVTKDTQLDHVFELVKQSYNLNK